MSQHPSLSGGKKDRRHRSVLKRHERLKHLIEKEKWDEKKSIFGLPKIKAIKYKIKKEKAAAPEAEAAAATPEAAAGAQPQATPPKAGDAKSAAGKATPPKEQKEKKEKK